MDKESAHLSDQKIRDSCLDQLRLAKNVSDAAGPASRPFFVACGLHKPHVPWVVPQEFFGFFPPVKEIPLAAYVYAPIGMPDAAWHPPADVKDMAETPSFNGTVNGADQNLALIPRSWPSFDVKTVIWAPALTLTVARISVALSRRVKPPVRGSTAAHTTPQSRIRTTTSARSSASSTTSVQPTTPS